MEDQVCLYFKYGYCKYKNKCKREHMKETCQDLNHCKDQRICNKRHPRVCKMYVEDRICRLRNDCAYHHPLEKEELTFDNKEINDLKEKVDTLKFIVHLLVKKIENLESEIHKIKGVETSEEVFEEEIQKEENEKKGNQENEVKEQNKKDKKHCIQEIYLKRREANIK